jgi:hypothetical protein
MRLIAPWILTALLACFPKDDGSAGDDTGIDGDADADADSDADSDADTDADSDADGDSDTDTDVEPEGPVAVCYADPDEVQALTEATLLTGSDSYDPAGGRLSYRWSQVFAPDGSVVVFSGTTSADPSFTTDVAGDYRFSLVVTDEEGDSSEACTANLEATVSQNLWVEVSWSLAGDDMDLHLVEEGGTLLGEGDCYYADTNPDWGVPNDSSDDPYLVLDDLTGVGPEITWIEDPANGTYEVWVVDYDGSVVSSPNDVTVNIYAGGALAWSDTRSISGEGEQTLFAEVTFPSGNVTGR